MAFIFRALAFCLCLWLPGVWAADSGWLSGDGNGHAQVRFSAARQASDRVDLVVQVALAPGWKTYWRSPGEGGVAPEIRWRTALDGVDWRWPVPQRFDVAGLSAQGYLQNVIFPIRLRTNAPRLQGVLTLPVCSTVCVLSDYAFDLDLAAAPPVDFRHTLARAEGALPLTSGVVTQVAAAYVPGELTLRAARPGGWRLPALFVDAPEGADFAAPRLWQEGDWLYARVAVSDGWQGKAPDLRGTPLNLLLSDDGVARQLSVTPITGSVAPPRGESTLTLFGALALALAGGLILNLMPCVLPVLAMKLGSVLHVPAADVRGLRRQFLLSAAGIISAFALLAALMSGLRLSQQAVGWGIQFQSPWFLALMMLVTLLFAANLFGFFTITLSSPLMTRLAGRSVGHFWQGILATLLATPCSAPFMGTALAFALAAPLAQLFGVGGRNERALAGRRHVAGRRAASSPPRALDVTPASVPGPAHAGVCAVAAVAARGAHRLAPRNLADGAGGAFIARAGPVALWPAGIYRRTGGRGHAGLGSRRDVLGQCADAAAG